MTMERVWEYPRPPAVVPCERRVRVELAGHVLADSDRALRVLETSHPPTIYVPPIDVRGELLATSDARATWCEFKGAARYVDAIVDGRRFKAIAWSYADPSAGYEALRDHIAFYTRVGVDSFELPRPVTDADLKAARAEISGRAPPRAWHSAPVRPCASSPGA